MIVGLRLYFLATKTADFVELPCGAVATAVSSVKLICVFVSTPFTGNAVGYYLVCVSHISARTHAHARTHTRSQSSLSPII